MLYVISQGGVPDYQDGQDALVYLVTSVERVIQMGLPVVFTDGNAASMLTMCFSDIEELDSRIDWELMRARMWRNTLSDGDRMRRRMAETLVHDHVPWAAFDECVTMTSETAERVRRVLAASPQAELPVRVAHDWYY